ncbi:transporter [Hymenobacter elongatus]|uniref:transporter n=1 Tax=Hymenobacter elongatus TaxID=877208 RepID=UPI001436A0A3|nr:transporter [Hymenobacter elongatus]
MRFFLLLTLATAGFFPLSVSVWAQTAQHTPAKGQAYTLFRPVPRDSLEELRPDRPGYSESPFTVDAGHFQLESDVFRLLTRRESDGRKQDIYLNYMLLKLGLTTHTDVQAEFGSYSWKKHTRDQQEPERHQGFGDLTVRVKRNLLGADGQADALALIGFARLPVGRAVGTSATEYGLMAPYSHDFSKQLNLQLQLRSDLSYDGDLRQRFLMLAPSTAIDYEFSAFLSAFAEVVGIWDTRQAAWQASFNVGPQLHLSDNVIVDFGTHLALTTEIDQEYFLGFSFRR